MARLVVQGKMRMFPPVTERSDAGYTLLELLVVIAIIGLILSSAPTIYARLVPQFQVREFANDLAVTARHLREEARRTQTVKALVFDGEDGVIAPSNLSVRFEQPMAWKTVERNTVEFYPSGASSGGVFIIERGGFQIELSIDWLSGAVKVKQ